MLTSVGLPRIVEIDATNALQRTQHVGHEPTGGAFNCHDPETRATKALRSVFLGYQFKSPWMTSYKVPNKHGQATRHSLFSDQHKTICSGHSVL